MVTFPSTVRKKASRRENCFEKLDKRANQVSIFEQKRLFQLRMQLIPANFCFQCKFMFSYMHYFFAWQVLFSPKSYFQLLRVFQMALFASVFKNSFRFKGKQNFVSHPSSTCKLEFQDFSRGPKDFRPLQSSLYTKKMAESSAPMTTSKTTIYPRCRSASPSSEL